MGSLTWKHIAEYLNEAVDKVRRAEHKQLKSEGNDTLTGTRQLWLFHPENLDDERNDILTVLRDQQLKTARAWALKDYFRWFRASTDEDSAKAFFDDWYTWAIRSRLDPVKKSAKMLKSRLANNSRIQSIKFNARGFRNFQNTYPLLLWKT